MLNMGYQDNLKLKIILKGESVRSGKRKEIQGEIRVLKRINVKLKMCQKTYRKIVTDV